MPEPMPLKREDGIRVALADGRIPFDVDGDWQDFAGELLAELDRLRAGMSTEWAERVFDQFYQREEIIQRASEETARWSARDGGSVLMCREVGPWVEVHDA
jgi:hypothetical protein